MATKTKATIVVERTEVIRTGKRGQRTWVLYKVFGRYADGRPFDIEHRTFDALPTGTVEVELEEYRNGSDTLVAYTCKLPERGQSTAHPAKRNGGDGDLEARVAKLERQMKALLSDSSITIP